MSSVRARAAAALVVLLAAACATAPPRQTMLDLKIVNGRIVDGTGAPWFRGDIGIRGDRIVAVGDLRNEPATAAIDAHDLAVAPGFIDLLGWSHLTVFTDPHLEAKLRDGVTTEICGEGESPAPVAPARVTREAPWRTLGDFLDALDRNGAAINFALFVGSSNPRQMVLGNVNRAATADELRQMERIVDGAMREGAIGLSSSLIYVPALFSTTEELVSLAKVAAAYGGVYFTHMRNESDRIDEALDEVFRIAREAAIPVNIWHLKVGGRASWGRMPHVIERITAARAEGLDVAANAYPYAASGTGLSTLAPDWAMDGGYAALRRRLADAGDRTRITETLRQQVEKRGPRAIYVTQIFAPALKQYEKKFVEEIGAAMGVTPEEAILRLFEASEASPRVIFFSISEDDVRAALAQPWISIGSDASSPTPALRAAGTAVHPRSYGTFSRFLGRYGRDEKLFSLEEGVRRITSQAAARVNLRDRGILRPGMKADVVVFDPAALLDRATFEKPHQFSTGVVHVIVNGRPVLRDGKVTGELPGQVIRGPGYGRTSVGHSP